MSFSQYESGTTRRPLPAGGAPTKVSSTRKKKEGKRLNLLNNYCAKPCRVYVLYDVHYHYTLPFISSEECIFNM